ncbi:MAG: hypothetical protein RIS36_341 [Pseudomonadota bacterium]
MTGFSRVSFGGHGVEIDVEVRSVNHRFLDVAVKGPRCYTSFERDIKSLFQRHHRRGRVEVSITRRSVVDGGGDSEILPASVDRYVTLFGAACRRYGVSTDSLGAFIGQVILREGNLVGEGAPVPEEEVGVLLRVIDEASEALAVMREGEGAALNADLSKRLEVLEGQVSAIQGMSTVAPARLRERLMERIRLIAPDVRVDEQRYAAEVAFLSDRIDISEEISRAVIHLAAFKDALKGNAEGVGRKLDFLTQEIGREFNTIGSKAQDAAVQGLVVEAKAELERIREQVQNIE